MRLAAAILVGSLLAAFAPGQAPVEPSADRVPFASRSPFAARSFEQPAILATRAGPAAGEVHHLPIAALGDVTGKVVADLGAGLARHRDELAARIGPDGSLIATEVAGPSPETPDDSVELALLSDASPLTPQRRDGSDLDKHGLLTSLHRVLVPGGEVVVTYITSSELRTADARAQLIERTRTDFRDYGFELGRHWVLDGPQSPLVVLEFRSPETGPIELATHMGREIAKTMHWRGAGWLVRAEREREENSARMLDALDVQPGWTLADFGCGNGYHTLELARRVGDTGRVYGVDIQPEMLTFLEQRAERAELTNVEPLLGSQLDAPLPARSCDLVLLADVYHELSNPVATLAAIRRSLKPRGRVAALEFRAEDPDVPIKPEHKMTRKQVIAEFEAAGFRLNDEFGELPWQHLLFFAVAPTEGR